DRNKKLGAKPHFTHAPRASSTPHRLADEDVHLSKCPRGLQEIEPADGGGVGMGRFSVSRLIHGIAIKTSGGERLAETKEHFFRGAHSMSEQRNGMRTRRYGENSKRGCVCSQHHFFDTNARLNDA